MVSETGKVKSPPATPHQEALSTYLDSYVSHSPATPTQKQQPPLASPSPRHNRTKQRSNNVMVDPPVVYKTPVDSNYVNILNASVQELKTEVVKEHRENESLRSTLRNQKSQLTALQDALKRTETRLQVELAKDLAYKDRHSEYFKEELEHVKNKHRQQVRA